MYEVGLRRQALEDVTALPKEYGELVARHIEQLQRDPRPYGSKKLKGSNEHSLRVGVYRILYVIDDDAQAVTVYRVKHRREAYR